MAIKVVQCVLIVSQVHYYSIIWIFKQKIEALPSFSFTQTFGWTAAVLGLGQDISERFREEVLYKALYKSTVLYCIDFKAHCVCVLPRVVFLDFTHLTFWTQT